MNNRLGLCESRRTFQGAPARARQAGGCSLSGVLEWDEDKFIK
jgi:hypothetical protein